MEPKRPVGVFRRAVGEPQRAILVSDGPLENFNGPFWFPMGRWRTSTGHSGFREGRWRASTGHSGFRRAVGELQRAILVSGGPLGNCNEAFGFCRRGSR